MTQWMHGFLQILQCWASSIHLNCMTICNNIRELQETRVQVKWSMSGAQIAFVKVIIIFESKRKSEVTAIRRVNESCQHLTSLVDET